MTQAPCSWRRARAIALVGSLLLSVAIAGCAKERGASYRCSCSYLTDFDDGSIQDVAVCAPSDDRAPDFARGCAQSGAPAPVDKCDCKRNVAAAGGCEVGLCKNLPRGE